MRAEVRVKVGKIVKLANVITGDTSDVREVTIVGSPKLYVNLPKGFDEKKDKEFGLVFELSRSGTLKVLDVLDPDEAEEKRRAKEVKTSKKATPAQVSR